GYATCLAHSARIGPETWTPSNGHGRNVANPRAALDTSVIVNFLCGGAGKDKPEWLDQRARGVGGQGGGEFALTGPVIVIAETAGYGQIRGNHLSRQVRRDRIRIVTDWIQSADFIPAEITLDIAVRAAQLAVEFQLSGADATVLATAQMHGCAWLFT